MIVEFGEWTPDRPALGGGSSSVVNSVPTPGGYDPMPWPRPIGPAGLPDRPIVLTTAVSTDGVTSCLAFTRSNVYRSVRANWLPVPGPVLATTNTWATAPWGDFLYAVNGVGSLMRFDDIAARMELVATPDSMGGNCLAVVGDHLVMGDIVKFGGTSRNKFRIEFSGNRRPDSFGFNPTISAGGNDMADIGGVQGLVGGEYGLIIGENGTSRMDFIGGTEVFQFKTVETEIGCDIKRSVIKAGKRAFWHSTRGWRMSGGDESAPIGEGRVDQWFLRRFDYEFAHLMSAFVLPNKPIIFWLYKSRYSPDETPDEVLCYNFQENKWSLGQFRADVLGLASSSSPFTDDADIVAVLGGTSGQIFTDQYPNVMTDGWKTEAGFAAALIGGTLHRLDPNGDRSYIEIPEVQLNQSGKATLRSFRAVAHSAQFCQAQVLHRKQQTDFGWKETNIINKGKSGIFRVRVTDNYHKVRIILDPPFSTASGVDILETTMGGMR